MKKIILFAAVIILAVNGFAQSLEDDRAQSEKFNDYNVIQEIELISCADPEYDWSQYDEKTGKALVTKKGLELESKANGFYCMSFCELPIAMQFDNFAVRFIMTPKEISDAKPFGIVYDVENEANYRMLLVMKKSFQVITVTDGKSAIVKKGVYKANNKSKQTEIDLVRQNDKLYFFINGLELLKLSSPKMENPTFGFVVAPKTKLSCNAIGYKKDTPQEE